MSIALIFLRPAIRKLLPVFVLIEIFHYGIAFNFLITCSIKSLFSFAEGSLFLYADLFRQRRGSALGTPANQSTPGGLTSWGVPLPANF